MKIAVIQASSQKDKNSLLFRCVQSAVAGKGWEAVNFGVFAEEDWHALSRTAVIEYVIQHGKDKELEKVLHSLRNM
ncbi:MAG: hypothetical protein HFH39_01060 [Lachnospiraceae bacterium]|nr:hypothetical protein [Lachnospiraceae bacterium]